MVTKKLLRRLLPILLLLCVSMPVFAIDDYVSAVYREIDSAFSAKSDKELNIILQENNGDKYYYLIENYATKKVRRLIITNDYEFAMDAILVIIDNNLENTDAVEMYATISDAYELQKQKELEEQQRQQRERERLAALKEDQRASAEKKYNTATNTEGKTVFSTGKDGKFTYSGWNFNIGFNPALLSNTSDGVQSILIGLALEAEGYKKVGDVIIAGDLFGNFHFLNNTIKGADESLYAQFELFPKLAFANFTDKLFLKVGFVGIIPIKPEISTKKGEAPAVADTLSALLTPALGVDFANIKLGNVGFSGGVDYYLGHLWTPDLNFAMGGKANLSFPIGETEVVKLNFNVGIKDVLYIKKSGIENRFNLILALGVQNVTK